MLSPTIGATPLIRLARELAAGQDLTSAQSTVGPLSPSDLASMPYAWAGALSLLIGGSRLGALLFAASMQTVALLSFWGAPTSIQAEGHLPAFVSLFMALLVLTSNRGHASAEDLEHAFTLLLRGLLLICFAFIALHKANTDFLDREVSCGYQMWPTQIFGLPSLAVALQLPRSPLMALTSEASIPLLLATMPRMGMLVLITVLGHLGAHGPQSITWLFIALSLSFLKDGDLAIVLRHPRALITLALLTASLAVLGAAQLPGAVDAGRIVRPGLYIFLVSSSFAIVMGLLLHDLQGRLRMGRAPAAIVSPSQPRALRPAQKAVLLCAACLLVGNELGPYLGIKHRYSLTMYSNLRADRGRWNSLLMPSWLKTFDYVDDHLVEIEIVRMVPLERRLSKPEQIGRAEFAQLIAMAAKRGERLRLRVEHRGAVHTYDSADPAAAREVLAGLEGVPTVRVVEMSIWPSAPDRRSLHVTTLCSAYLSELLAKSTQLDVTIGYRGERRVFRDAHSNAELRRFVEGLPVAHGLFGAKALSLGAPQSCVHGV